MNVVVRRFADRDEAGRALAEVLAGILAQAGGGAVAVPGGRSPGSMLGALFARDLPWSQTVITLTDDRWVPVGSPDSNEGMARGHLRGTPAEAAMMAGLVGSRSSAAEGVAEVAARLSVLPATFSAVVAGLGDDGHTASLFPGQPWEDAGGAPCIPGRAPVPPHDRISLTMTRLIATRRLFLLFGGEHRLGLLNAPTEHGLPVTVMLARSPVPVEVFHFPN